MHICVYIDREREWGTERDRERDKERQRDTERDREQRSEGRHAPPSLGRCRPESQTLNPTQYILCNNKQQAINSEQGGGEQDGKNIRTKHST